MKTAVSELNLVLAWIWILLGFGSGLLLGLKFNRENWLGGYASFKRRLYRLGHISFFGLGAINLMFHFTARCLPEGVPLIETAAWLLAAGAVTMPVCCVVMAHRPKAQSLFAVPVLSLLAGGALTLWIVVKSCSRNS